MPKTVLPAEENPIPACFYLAQLLSEPPKRDRKPNNGATGGTGSSPTYHEDSMKITRAYAACKLGLFRMPGVREIYEPRNRAPSADTVETLTPSTR